MQLNNLDNSVDHLIQRLQESCNRTHWEQDLEMIEFRMRFTVLICLRMEHLKWDLCLELYCNDENIFLFVRDLDFVNIYTLIGLIIYKKVFNCNELNIFVCDMKNEKYYRW